MEIQYLKRKIDNTFVYSYPTLNNLKYFNYKNGKFPKN